MEKSEVSTSQRILEHVMAAIRSGQISPGERVIPKNIAERVGTSPIPVREVLYQLVGQEILIERHREGFYVAPLNAVTLQSLYTEHARIIDTCVMLWRSDIRRVAASRDPWDLFAVISGQSQCPALIGIQRYLARRLVPTRTHEMDRAQARKFAATLIAALRAGEVVAAQNECARFHQQCAQMISTMITRMSRS